MRRILLISELSDDSRMAYTQAAIVASKFNAKICLGFFGRRSAPEYSGISNEEHRRSVHRKLRQECSRPEFNGIETEFRFLCGRNIRRSIEEFEHTSRPDLIIMTSAAISGWKRYFSNDKTSKVVSSSSVPVWMVGPAVTLTNIEPPRRVLVPFDFSDRAFGTLPLIRMMANQYGCAFKLVKIRRTVKGTSKLRSLLLPKQQRPRIIRQRFARLLHEELDGLEIETEIADGDPPTEARRLAREMEADLIIVGTQGILDRESLDIARAVHCPVVTSKANLSCAFDSGRNRMAVR